MLYLIYSEYSFKLQYFSNKSTSSKYKLKVLQKLQVYFSCIVPACHKAFFLLFVSCIFNCKLRRAFAEIYNPSNILYPVSLTKVFKSILPKKIKHIYILVHI